MSGWNVASCTPWERSLTVSLSGQRVALIRRRKSRRASSGMCNENGRIAWRSFASSAAVAASDVSKPAAAAAEIANTLRRVGVDGALHMIILPYAREPYVGSCFTQERALERALEPLGLCGHQLQTLVCFRFAHY